MTKIKRAVIILSAIICMRVSAQNPSGNDPKVKVYLDCKEIFCDWNFIIPAIPMIDYVRDPFQAGIHVVITRQQTGSGGYVYHLDFIRHDSLTAKALYVLDFLTTSTTTQDELQNLFIRNISTGLLPFISQKGEAGSYTLEFPKKSTALVGKNVDPWDYWVFNLNAMNIFNGEKTSKFFSNQGSISSNRITDDWKFSLAFSLNYYEERFEYELSPGVVQQTRNIRRSALVNSLLLKSLSDHWSAGGSFTGQQNIFTNLKSSLFGYSAVEYNIFPYTESSKHQMRIGYRLGAGYQQYVDTTIYLRIDEQRTKHRFSLNTVFIMPWGSITGVIVGSQYLYDLKKNNLSLSSSVNLRLIEGLSFTLYGNYEAIHDQISLRKQVATIEDVLRQQRQLETSYSYYVMVGINYTFGSMYNNIVNVRFDE